MVVVNDLTMVDDRCTLLVVCRFVLGALDVWGD